MTEAKITETIYILKVIIEKRKSLEKKLDRLKELEELTNQTILDQIKSSKTPPKDQKSFNVVLEQVIDLLIENIKCA